MDSKINLKKSLKSNTAALCPVAKNYPESSLRKRIGEIGEILWFQFFLQTNPIFFITPYKIRNFK